VSNREDYHVLTKAGDASSEVEAAVREIGGAEAAGLHRHFFVTRANQTVVLALSSDSRIVRLLRGARGWLEPADVDSEN
jgi:hypothetical protein